MRREILKFFQHRTKRKQELVLATGNPDKVREIKKLLAGAAVKIIPYKGKSPKETGRTLEQNAAIKALCAARSLKKWAIADDTGLEVEALSGRPGVFSARFAGSTATYEDNVKKLLKVMKGVPPKKRRAVFKTAVCIASPEEKTFTVIGKCCGFITEFPVGKNGFGYDPVFYYPPMKKTFAQMTLKEKNRVSHRSRAFKEAKKLIRKIFTEGVADGT